MKSLAFELVNVRNQPQFEPPENSSNECVLFNCDHCDLVLSNKAELKDHTVATHETYLTQKINLHAKLKKFTIAELTGKNIFSAK